MKSKIRHRSAKATFKKTLILNGIPLEAAQELSRAYPNPLNEVLSLMKIRGKDLKLVSEQRTLYAEEQRTIENAIPQDQRQPSRNDGSRS